MSIVKSIMKQLGLSGDPAKNFTFSVPAAPDGTMKLARGNAGATTQDIMTVDAAGKVAFPQNVQTLQNVKGSRVVGTTYTNSTGQPITVMVSGTSTSIAAMAIALGGLIVYGSSAGIGGLVACTFVVPNGATYAVGASAGTLTIAEWAEIR